MRNDELFSPRCPDKHVNKLVTGYVMRGLLDKRGAYYPENLLARQHAVYEEWLAEMHERSSNFSCGFYEWMSRNGDAAFVFKLGDLVKHAGHYCVVTQRCPTGITWANDWRVRNGTVVQEPWPQAIRTVKLKDPYDRTYIVDVLSEDIEPAEIPPEVFALACEKAKGCPLMRGGTE